MKKKVFALILIPFLFNCFLTGCHYQPVTPITPEEVALKQAKETAIETISIFVDLNKYRQAEQNQIRELIVSYSEEINNCKSIEEVNLLVAKFKDTVSKIKTDEQYSYEEKYDYNKCNSTAQIDAYKKEGYLPLHVDSNFKTGFDVTKTYQKEGESPYHDKPIKIFKNSLTPQWRIAQWSSQYDIAGDDPQKDGFTLTSDLNGLKNTMTSKGKIVNGYFVPGKRITCNTYNGELTLECNCSVEYEHPRTSSEGWVHVLFENSFGNKLLHVSECSSIVMDCEFSIDSCINRMGDDFNPNMHTAQLVWYITIQNRNMTSPEYGRYIWFGVGLWDYRNRGNSAGSYIAHDAGTNTLIYNPSSSEYYKENNGRLPNIAQKARARLDVMDFAMDAFEYAKSKGYFDSTTFDDLYVGGTNIGYEVPGTFDIVTTINAFNIFYK